MTELFDFFPFNMPAGPGFLFVYIGLAAVLLFVGTRVRNAVARNLDESVAPKPPIGGDVYRSSAEPGPLMVGVLPQPQQLWAVAWLRDGKAGVAQALLANAVAEGWLVSGEAGAGAPFALQAKQVVCALPPQALPGLLGNALPTHYVH